MIVVVTGTRHVNDLQAICDAHLSFIADQRAAGRDDRISSMIVGDARGMDSAALAYAEARKIPVTVYRAEWARYHASAGPRRNQVMVEAAAKAKADGQEVCCWAFPNAYLESKGTADMVRRCTVAGIPVISRPVGD